jgi:phosphatidylglycerol:prolipoprotein diacylglycerol transferase
MAFPYLTDVLRAVGIDMPLPIPLFGLFVGIAFLAGQWVAKIEMRRLVPTLPPEFTTNACLYAFLAGLVGARLFHILEYPREFLEDPAAMLLSRGGFTIFGGLIAGTLTAVWYARRNKAPIPQALDAAGLGLMLAYGIGRIGCQISGDGDWGIAVTSAAPAWLPDWLWAQTYDGNIAGVTIPPPGVYPTPIYETLMSFVAFSILWKLRRHSHAPGWLFGVYLLLAGVERLLIEFIRVNTYYVLFGVHVTQAQLIAAACVIAGLVVMWRRRAAPRVVPATA